VATAQTQQLAPVVVPAPLASALLSTSTSTVATSSTPTTAITSTSTSTSTSTTTDGDDDDDDLSVTGRIPLVTPMPEMLGTAPATPLERAVQDLIEAIKPKDKDEPIAMPVAQVAAAPSDGPAKADPGAPVAPVHVVTPAPVIEAMSHAHLVLGDGDQRVVVTVAVRGDNVHVALRGTDEHLMAAMARNVTTLDDSLRHRGLALSEMKTTDDSQDAKDAPKERVYRETEDKEPESDEVFSLEEQS
jgi:hypothetical protein